MLNRLKDCDAKVYRTDIDGTIVLTCNGTDISIETIETDTDGNSVNKDTIQSMQPDNESIIVYVTQTGSKYHVENCSSLPKSKIEISLEEAIKKYEPCSMCNPSTL